VRPPEVRLAKVRLAEVRLAEARPLEVRPSEVRPAEVRLAKVRLAEVRTTEVRQYEVRLAKVRLDIGIPVTPSVPGGLALLEQRDVLFVRHGSTPEVLEKNDAAVVDGSERSDHCPNDLAKQQATATSSASTSKSSSFHSPDRREADARLRTKVTRLSPQSRCASLFDQLIGACEQRPGHLDAECLRDRNLRGPNSGGGLLSGAEHELGAGV